MEEGGDGKKGLEGDSRRIMTIRDESIPQCCQNVEEDFSNDCDSST